VLNVKSALERQSVHGQRGVQNIRALTRARFVCSERETHSVQDRRTYTMIGPSFGTFSAPMTRTSVKNDQTAQPASFLMILCSVLGCEL